MKSFNVRPATILTSILTMWLLAPCLGRMACCLEDVVFVCHAITPLWGVLYHRASSTLLLTHRSLLREGVPLVL
jgi:hypothetical protein